MRYQASGTSLVPGWDLTGTSLALAVFPCGANGGTSEVPEAWYLIFYVKYVLFGKRYQGTGLVSKVLRGVRSTVRAPRKVASH